MRRELCGAVYTLFEHLGVVLNCRACNLHAYEAHGDAEAYNHEGKVEEANTTDDVVLAALGLVAISLFLAHGSISR